MDIVDDVILAKDTDTKVWFWGGLPSTYKDFDNTVFMGDGYITVDSITDSDLDREATVTMNVNSCQNLIIYKHQDFIEDTGNNNVKDDIINGGAVCNFDNNCLTVQPICENNVATFEVKSFSSYAGEGDEGGGSVPEFSDYMLMLTFLIAGFAVYRKMPELITEKQ